jgi:hypothetical protein
MKGWKLAAAAVATWVSVISPGIAQDYLCLGGQLAGFTWNKATRKWVPKALTGDIKFVVKKNADSQGPPGTGWIVNRIGKMGVAYWCHDSLAYGDSLVCNSSEGDFRVNLRTRRFMEANYSSYIDDGTTDFTPTLAIGECTRL